MKSCKASFLVMFYCFGLVSIGLFKGPAQAQILNEYDANLAPFVTGDNPPPQDNRFHFLPPLNPTSPLGWGLKVLTIPNTAGSWDETCPSDHLDVNSDGRRDMSAPYYPSSWKDANQDGTYDSCG